MGFKWDLGWDLGFGMGFGMGFGIGMGMGFGIWGGMGWDGILNGWQVYVGLYMYRQCKDFVRCPPDIPDILIYDPDVH